jgi:ABC-type dipeptide/oligopeptide/nickel transport system permease subunit
MTLTTVRAVVAIVGSSLTNITVILAFSGWVIYTRTVRAAVTRVPR